MERLTNADEARDALAAMTAAKRQLADIAQCPPWRHAAFAGLEATLVAIQRCGYIRLAHAPVISATKTRCHFTLPIQHRMNVSTPSATLTCGSPAS